MVKLSGDSGVVKLSSDGGVVKLMVVVLWSSWWWCSQAIRR